MLRERLQPPEHDELNQLFAQPEVDGPGVARVLALLERTGVRQDVETEIARFHDAAATALLDAAKPGPNPARERLLALVERLSVRTG
jgi:hypothetical protein